MSNWEPSDDGSVRKRTGSGGKAEGCALCIVVPLVGLTIIGIGILTFFVLDFIAKDPTAPLSASLFVISVSAVSTSALLTYTVHGFAMTRLRTLARHEGLLDVLQKAEYRTDRKGRACLWILILTFLFSMYLAWNAFTFPGLYMSAFVTTFGLFLLACAVVGPIFAYQEYRWKRKSLSDAMASGEQKGSVDTPQV